MDSPTNELFAAYEPEQAKTENTFSEEGKLYELYISTPHYFGELGLIRADDGSISSIYDNLFTIKKNRNRNLRKTADEFAVKQADIENIIV